MVIKKDAIYDSGANQTQQILPVTVVAGVSTPGTASSDTVLTRVRVPVRMMVVGASVLALTGGTAVGPYVALGKSLAGTGTVAQFGTHKYGTVADDVGANISVTETEFDAGDHLVLTNLAGTAASTPVGAVSVVWKGDVG